MYACQQILVSQSSELIAILTFLCEQYNKLTNKRIYYPRKLDFKTGFALGQFEFAKVYKNNNYYRVINSQTA